MLVCWYDRPIFITLDIHIAYHAIMDTQYFFVAAHIELKS